MHIRWAVVANVEVFRIGTVGQSTAHRVGPVPNNLLTADKILKHITGYYLITVFDWASPVWSVRLCHRSLIWQRSASFSPHCTRTGWHHSSCSCSWTCTGSPHSCRLQSKERSVRSVIFSVWYAEPLTQSEMGHVVWGHFKNYCWFFWSF